jgi:cytochrome P450
VVLPDFGTFLEIRVGGDTFFQSGECEMSDNGFDFSSDVFRLNPYPTYDQMRESGGPTWMPHSGPTGGIWLFTRYDDVLAIFKEARIGKDVRRVLPDAQQGPFDVHLLNVDPPGHTRLRSLVNIAFTPKRIKDLEPSIRQITNDLLDEILVRGGEIEFVRDFAFPLPVIVIAELLGVPPP